MKPKLNVAIKFSAATLLFTALACSGAVTPTSSIDSVSTVVAATLQALTPLASPTQPPTPTPLATSTSAPPPAPTSSNLPNPTRIDFAAGATQSVVEGNIQAAQTLYYVVRASKDQPMLVILVPPDDGITLSIFGANGEVLLPASQQGTGWQGILPATQDYYFRLTGGGSTQNFTLNVNIPARIQFSAGQNQITLTGQTVGGYAVSYAAYASGGEKMDVTIVSSSGLAALTIWGLSDGQPYARAQNGVTDFSMTLPSTQDYIIEVVPQGGQVVNYKLTVKIQ